MRKGESMGGAVMDTLKSGLVNGPTLYGAQKIVAAVDMAVGNYATKAATTTTPAGGLPQELRTPLVGVALALVPELLFDDRAHPYAGKVSEYLLASALAQTLTLAGNKGVGPGVIDAMVNKVLAPIAGLGAASAAAGGAAGFLRGGAGAFLTPTGHGMGSTGVPHGARQTMRGFITE